MPSATDSASEEAAAWIELAIRWGPDHCPQVWTRRPPTELATVRFFDPASDLERRAAPWGYRLDQIDLPGLCRFVGALATAESDAWAADQPDTATRAYEARRFLLADRLVHWAVPWLDAVNRCFPARSEEARVDRDQLILRAERMRVAPAHLRGEGLVAPGHDQYGPLVQDAPLQERLDSLWSGMVLFDEVGSAAEGGNRPLQSTHDLSRLIRSYDEAEEHWGAVAKDHPGSAALWLDLSERARATVDELVGRNSGEL